MIDLRLKQAVSSPSAFDTKTLDRFANAMQTALAKQVPVDPGLLDAAGKRFLEASGENSAAWQPAMNVLNYKSSIGSIQYADARALPKSNCMGVPTSGGMGLAVSDSRFMGCFQELDHVEWKDVTFLDATIIYRGGPVKLENVQFKDCRFLIDYSAAGRELGKTLLSSTQVNISLPNH